MTDFPTPPPSQPPSQSPGQPPAQPGPKRLTRSRDDRWIAGVCGGVAEYAGVDPNLVRLLAIVGGIFSAGTLLVAYVIAWIVMPEA